MKSLHIGAFVLFGLALVFYAAAWIPGGVAFGVLGIFCEVAAWVYALSFDPAKQSKRD